MLFRTGWLLPTKSLCSLQSGFLRHCLSPLSDLLIMGCINSVPQASLMYKDPAGNLHVYNPSEAPNHSPSMQVKHVATREQGKVRGGEEFYLITRSWLTQWIEFTKGDVPKFATRIDNSLLIDPSDANKLLSTVEFKKDYRLVRKEVWEYYFELFGASPIIVLTGKI